MNATLLKKAPEPKDLNAERPVPADDKFVKPEDRKTSRPAGTAAGCPGDNSWL
jgi:hypothetical protein